MIVRDLLRHPDHTDQLIQTFDYLNDERDTLAWLRSIENHPDTPEQALRAKDIRERLEEGSKAYWDAYHSDMKKRIAKNRGE